MIGNDVVDLSLAKKTSNWKRPRFRDKSFTEGEQLVISNSLDKDRMVWRLWSMKEAAYKAYVREFENPFFNPKKLSCKLISGKDGVVHIYGNYYATVTKTGTDYVHTVAFLKAPKLKFTNRVFYLNSDDHRLQSKAVKQVLTTMLCNTYAIKKTELFSFKKNDFGVPNLFFCNKRLDKSFSLSHHGRFGAFAIC